MFFAHEGASFVVVTMLSSTCVATRIVSPSLSFLLHIAPSYPAFWKSGLSSQFDHMDAAEYCLKYLAGTANLRIHYDRTMDGKIEGRELNRLWDWVDADFSADLDTRRSHTGYVIMMNGGPISWKSVRQKGVSLSTAESERYAASEAGKELLYLRIIMREFGSLN
jgi:hypothetical protein